MFTSANELSRLGQRIDHLEQRIAAERDDVPSDGGILGRSDQDRILLMLSRTLEVMKARREMLTHPRQEPPLEHGKR